MLENTLESKDQKILELERGLKRAQEKSVVSPFISSKICEKN